MAENDRVHDGLSEAAFTWLTLRQDQHEHRPEHKSQRGGGAVGDLWGVNEPTEFNIRVGSDARFDRPATPICGVESQVPRHSALPM